MGIFRRRHRPTWQEQHPLPAGWRPRTRIDMAGRLVEPWQWIVSDAHNEPLDAGEQWLPHRFDPDAAAYEILSWWLTVGAPEMQLAPHEIAGLRCSARPGAYVSDRVGVAFAVEAVLETGR